MPVLASLKEYTRTLQPERRHFLARYRPIDVAFKVVGTGSVGLRAYCIYMEGNGPNDPLFLQIKEEPASAWSPYLPTSVQHINQGRRVENGQRAMQLQSDPFLGYTTIEGRDYLVRQLNDHKASIDFHGLGPHIPLPLRRPLRRTPGPRPRPLRLTAQDCRLSRQNRPLRQSHPGLRHRLRRPDRA